VCKNIVGRLGEIVCLLDDKKLDSKGQYQYGRRRHK
jgi:hypothetical protein